MAKRIVKLGSKESGLSPDCDDAGLWVVQEKMGGQWITCSEAMEWEEAKDALLN